MVETGVLADKFHCYKLILIIIVFLVGTFHTSLLHIDARIPSDLLPLTSDWEAPAELFCSRTEATVQIGKFSCDASRIEWTVDWTPSECQPVDCDVPARMSLCLPDGNCTQIAIGSTSKLEMDVSLAFLKAEANHNGTAEDCQARIVSAQTDQTRDPATFLCNCNIRCPAVAAPNLLNMNNTISEEQLQRLEQERQKHNRGFWLYFVLRVIASGSLATSFSM